MLSLKDNRDEKGNQINEPIAMVYTMDLKRDGTIGGQPLKVVYLDRNPKPLHERFKIVEEKGEVVDPIELLGEDYFKKGRTGRMINKKNISEIKETLSNFCKEQEVGDVKVKNTKEAKVKLLTMEACEDIDNKIGREYIFGMGEYVIPFPLPNIENNPKFREVLYIAGPAGSGKSTYASRYIRLWLKSHPGDNVYVFSTVPSDECIDIINDEYKDLGEEEGKKIRRIKIDESLITNPLAPEEFTGSLLIFDDIDNIGNKVLRSAIQTLRDQVMAIGRHGSTYVINTSHQFLNWKETRASINEATSVTFFPKSGSIKGIESYLSTYSGLTKKQIERILDLPSRWVTLYCRYPKYVVYEHGVYLL